MPKKNSEIRKYTWLAIPTAAICSWPIWPIINVSTNESDEEMRFWSIIGRAIIKSFLLITVKSFCTLIGYLMTQKRAIYYVKWTQMQKCDENTVICKINEQ